MRVPLAQYPGMNRFVLDWLNRDAKATNFLPRDASERGKRNADPKLAQAIIESNKRWGLFVRPEVEKWQNGGAMFIAGQQVGFAGGPIYTLAKIASLVKMKRALEAQGKPATVFFWLATEDHDYEEAATLCVPVSTIDGAKSVNRQLDLLCMRAIRATSSHAVVGSLPVPEGLITQLLAMYDLERPQWLREGITFGDSFAELIASVFGNEVVLIDALLPELRRAGASLFDEIRKRKDDIQAALSRRSEELIAAGYHEQVVARDGAEYTLLFDVRDDGTRHTTCAFVEPERTSTSALTRPLLQDLVLQPDVFMGGPAEVAYYAQIAPLHAMLGIAMPRVALRGHALIAPKRLLRAIDRYGIEPAEFFTPVSDIVAEREPEKVAGIRRAATDGKTELLKSIAKISALALPADHAVARRVQRSIGHIEYHFDKLVTRAVEGLVRKDRERWTAVRELVTTLHPDGNVQDRIVGWFGWWCLHGPYVVERLLDEIEPDSDHFRIIAL